MQQGVKTKIGFYHHSYNQITIGQTTGVARNFELGREGQNGKNDVITDFLKFDFVIISLKKQNLATSRKSLKSKIKGRWERKAPSA